MQSMKIFDFNKTSNIDNWKVIDDVVMGGKSSGTFYLNKEGKGVFKGSVSLENNGGFSSVKYQFKEIKIKQYSKIVLKIKGDGKTYQFRLKSKSSDSHSYITYFKTTAEWETIKLSLTDFYPTFRGRKLDMPNYDHQNLEEISFLIGNKTAENFNLEIDTLTLE
jgi:NADH dehydrogenase [ubiquinone] 1 alpha subcomplex assembly factor 1